jgi:hypothetical protein
MVAAPALMTFALWRSRSVPRWLAVLFLLGLEVAQHWRAAGLVLGRGRLVAPGPTVPVCGPGLRQVVEDRWTHRGLPCRLTGFPVMPPLWTVAASVAVAPLAGTDVAFVVTWLL